MKWKDGDKEKLKQIIKQVSGNIDDIEGELLESAKIKGKGDMWCYGPLSNQMIRVRRGTHVYVVSEEIDEQGMVIAYVGPSDVILIKKDELIEVGFN